MHHDLCTAHENLKKGTANRAELFNWCRPHSLKLMSKPTDHWTVGDYSLNDPRWRVAVENRLFSWNRNEKDRPAFLVKADKAFNVSYLWGLHQRLNAHANYTYSFLLKERDWWLQYLKDNDCKEYTGWIPYNPHSSGEERENSEGCWLTLRPHRSSYGEKETLSWSWSSNKDKKARHDLEKLALYASDGEEVDARLLAFAEADARSSTWRNRAYTVNGLLQAAIERLLPSPFSQGPREQIARIQLPGGVVTYMYAPGRYGGKRMEGGWNKLLTITPGDKFIELNFDPEKGPISSLENLA